MPSNLHAAARQWALFMPVFPCSENSKKPLPNSRGFEDATRDVQQIDRWWTENPNYNIAACPEHAGFVVVDVDGVAGADTLELWETATGVKCYAEIITPSGGRHLWYRGSMPSSVKRLAPGIDVRGVGGYVLLPPSIVDGKEYVFRTY